MPGSNSPPTLAGPITRRQKLVRYWVAHPKVDRWLLVPAGIWLLLAWLTDHRLAVASLPVESRRPIWTTLMGTSGTVAGLMLASVSILINLLKTPLSAIDKLFTKGQQRAIGDTILAGMPALGGLFVVSMIASLTDSRTAVGLWAIEALVVVFLAASGSHFARVVWIIRKLLAVSGA